MTARITFLTGGKSSFYSCDTRWLAMYPERLALTLRLQAVEEVVWMDASLVDMGFDVNVCSFLSRGPRTFSERSRQFEIGFDPSFTICETTVIRKRPSLTRYINSGTYRYFLSRVNMPRQTKVQCQVCVNVGLVVAIDRKITVL